MTPSKPRPDRESHSAEQQVGAAARGVIRQIDRQLHQIQQRLEGYEPLIAERDRLIAARNALTGHAPTGKPSGPRIAQEDIASYLQEHPGALPAQIAADLGVPVTNVSQHLYRGKGSRFARQKDGWHVL